MALPIIDLRREYVTTPIAVPKLWPGSTIVCVGGGPSLTRRDVMACYLKARVIAVNDAYRLANWADAIMASDAKWWRVHNGVPGYVGRRYCLQPVPEHSLVMTLRNTGRMGIETDPTGLRSGSNSGAAAINLAVHFGASRIVLLGYDMKKQGGKSHWFGDHPKSIRCESPYHVFKDMIATQVQPLQELGVEVINCSRETALDVWPRRPLEECLA